QRRNADEDEAGSYELSAAKPHVVVCPSKSPGELGLDGTACTQVGAWLVSSKAKTRLPEWLAEGFGRATALYALGTKYLSADRRRAALFVEKNNRSLDDITKNNLKPEEIPALRASVADYLAYSGLTSKFL